MSCQMTFRRYELKYLLTEEQQTYILEKAAPYMEPDKYPSATIRNIYFDTDNSRLIRHSIEHPPYKEKLRIRSYHQVSENDPVFVELKKKYRSVVYKRRMELPFSEAMNWFRGRTPDCDTQIAREIEYFRQYYGNLSPAVFLSYNREAYCSKDGSSFRLTFDKDILARRSMLSLTENVWGTKLLEPGCVLMELKTAAGLPLWMAHLLSEMGIYKASFSKYGTAYQKLIYPYSERRCFYA